LALRTNHRLAADYGVELAASVDLFMLEGQRLQGDADTLRTLMLPVIRALRQSNPNLEIGVQLRSEGSGDHLTALTDSLWADLDGVLISYSPTTMNLAQEFASQLRSGEGDLFGSPLPLETQMPVALTPTSMPQPVPVATAAPLPTPTAPRVLCTWPAGLVLAGSSWVAARAQRRSRRTRRRNVPGGV
jgi:hypothetical protein